MTTTGKNIYKTAIAKSKQNDFLAFLRNLGIKREELNLTHSRGDFFIYEIDLSKRTEDSIKYLRGELNNSQIEFL